MLSGFETVRRGLGRVSWKLIMEKMLYDAAVENNVSTLHQLLRQDPLILDKASLNCQDMNPLHVAAMLGNVEFVKEVLPVSSDMCLAADRFGRIPLHLAVIKGRLPVLKELIEARPRAAREKTEGGGNVLHLCVKYNQLEALMFLVDTIKDKDFANRKDDDGMTILHQAICDNQTETIQYLLDNKIVDVNAKNANGNTALDLFHGGINSKIERALERAGADGIGTLNDDKWLSEKRETLMVVASLVATMAFQAAVNPTMGVWQDDSGDQRAFEFFSDYSGAPPPHSAGQAVMDYKDHDAYTFFIRTNTIAFVSSLSVIMMLISGLPFRHRFFLWVLTVTMWLTITSIALTYGVSVLVTPKRPGVAMYGVTNIGILVWCGVMLLLLLGNTIRLINRCLKRCFGINVLKILRRSWESAFGKKSHDKQGSSQMC